MNNLNEDFLKKARIYTNIENGRHNKTGGYYIMTGDNLSVCYDGDVGWITQEGLNPNTNWSFESTILPNTGLLCILMQRTKNRILS